jgi:hypothetical protein
MKCSGCLQVFTDNDFKTCEKCRLKVKKYHSENKNQLNQKRKLYSKKNKNIIKEKKHQYYIENIEKISNKDQEKRIQNKYNYALKRAKNNACISNIEFDLDIEYIHLSVDLS